MGPHENPNQAQFPPSCFVATTRHFPFTSKTQCLSPQLFIIVPTSYVLTVTKKTISSLEKPRVRPSRHSVATQWTRTVDNNSPQVTSHDKSRLEALPLLRAVTSITDSSKASTTLYPCTVQHLLVKTSLEWAYQASRWSLLCLKPHSHINELVTKVKLTVNRDLLEDIYHSGIN